MHKNQEVIRPPRWSTQQHQSNVGCRMSVVECRLLNVGCWMSVEPPTSHKSNETNEGERIRSNMEAHQLTIQRFLMINKQIDNYFLRAAPANGCRTTIDWNEWNVFVVRAKRDCGVPPSSENRGRRSTAKRRGNLPPSRSDNTEAPGLRLLFILILFSFFHSLPGISLLTQCSGREPAVAFQVSRRCGFFAAHQWFQRP